MTHGFGGFSSGGGGGGGGFSGFSGGHHHVHVDAHSGEGGAGLDREVGECCCFCFMCGINIFGVLLCFKKMPRYVRIGLLWLYITLVVVLVGVFLAVNVLGTRKFQTAPTDMRIVDKSLNNAFCQSLRLKSTDSFTAYAFGSEPEVDQNSIEMFNTSYSVVISGEDYDYRGFYFLQGSSATIVASGGGSMYVIKGEDNLHDWIHSEGTCGDCFLDKHSLSSSYTYHLKVIESDDYYIMMYSPTYTTLISYNVYITRTLYDVSKATSSCTFMNKGSKPCDFDVSLSPSHKIVYHNGPTAQTDQSIDMWSTCSSRAWMYVIVFALIPCIFGAALSILFWKKCRDSYTQEESALFEESDHKY